MEFWLIVVIAFGAALVLGFGIVLRRARADAVSGTATTTLTTSSPVAVPPAPTPPAGLDRAALDDAVRALLAEGKLIPAVKLVRERTGFGLKDAKEYVDRLPAGASAPPPAPSPDTVTPEAMAHIQQLVAQGRKIQAIKVLREHTGLGLKQAKDTVERMEESGVVAALDVAAPAAPPSSDEVMARVRALAAQGKKIHAIKELRDHRPGLGLKEAKDIVERL
ncbi:Ribosomal protein L7/L12 C-terminal domain-containing protein [Jiangella alba]|uniref:Ribosomal protein L7/L12 C-terminal domain-containing protein n=1 Tax=Jiangella alba TaxID=561176 RepID=A0A1H5MUX9_9ACTN|nr:ribosomal protein L7/L12 [Jiangella alba]SEE93073.1 Ribosomal protein L7/L12 C-terminal domain-containing protein [Jiangella alba]